MTDPRKSITAVSSVALPRGAKRRVVSTWDRPRKKAKEGISQTQTDVGLFLLRKGDDLFS
jgi:hypothetical protein